MLAGVGGRKFALSLFGVTCITALAFFRPDSIAFGSIAIIVGAYNGANALADKYHHEAK
jgi:hypothetical protein